MVLIIQKKLDNVFEPNYLLSGVVGMRSMVGMYHSERCIGRCSSFWQSAARDGIFAYSDTH